MGDSKQSSTQSRSSGSRLEAVRNHNLALIARSVVTSPQPLSRADLAALTGLNRSTVTRLVDSLINFGIVTELATEKSPGSGRPSIPLVPAPHTHVSIGAEISDTAIRTRVLDLAGNVLAEHFQELNSSTEPAEVLSFLRTSVQRHEKQIAQSQMHIVGLACAIPGLIIQASGLLHSAPILGWKNVDIANHLSPDDSESPYPIIFENSIKLAAFNELIETKKIGAPLNDFLFISGSSGIGSAIVRHGAIESGSHGWAGEIGHIPVSESKELCSCGQTGCLETQIGRASLLEKAGFDRTAPIGNLFAALYRHDRDALKAVDETGKILGQTVAGCLNLLDLPAIRLGGIFAEIFTYMEKPIQAELKDRVLFYDRAPVTISASTLGEQSSTDGAAWTMILRFLDSPETWTVPSDYSLEYYDVNSTPEIVIED
ncbi:ROK family transcriptional regulator [Arcanobacterium ihumii]|uniref:ROK family transcriptional regulator n=1 Tax=Arcanobacterium ihumii TaxID=2138162 RepID=UPI000F535997|nr:ROK family transcriptional regulator [Arcanobacterium ihumii]